MADSHGDFVFFSFLSHRNGGNDDSIFYVFNIEYFHNLIYLLHQDDFS